MDIASGWSDFFVAEAGASAGLAGLVFVAVSINLKQILEYPHLPARVMEGLITLLTVLAVATFSLVPSQSAQAQGIEIGGTGLMVWAIKTTALIRSRRSWTRRPRPAVRIFANQLPPIPFIVAGALLLAGEPSALYWTIPGTLLSFAGGLIDAWVLLIEIKR
jgi:hypothetical protein